VNIYEKKQRWKYFLLVSAILIGAGSLIYTNMLVDIIEENERKQVELWAEATRILGNTDLEDHDISFPLEVIQNNTQIPVILTNSNDSVLSYRNLDSTRVHKYKYINRQLNQMKNENDSIVINLGNNQVQYLYYSNSGLLKKLAVFPYIQLGVIVLFILVSYIAFSVSRKAEQNKVWTGLSKETAHQLGTPISSLLGWIEILKQYEIEESTVSELEKDALRLERIADRFSKIGSAPTLKNMDIISILENSLSYIRARAAKNFKLLTNLPKGPILIPLNETLFDWVIENLCKNALDATEGSGSIALSCRETDHHVLIDIEDTGKGIPKSKFKTIFKPGYTTKKRGWGLGLSLTKRIVEEYHNGKIFVLSSEPGVKTVIRISLQK
jgi:two-component system, sporulation sensor kinase D